MMVNIVLANILYLENSILALSRGASAFTGREGDGILTERYDKDNFGKNGESIFVDIKEGNDQIN